MYGQPGRLAAISLPLGVAYDLRRRLALINADQQALPCRPRRILALRLAMATHLLVDRIGGTAHGEFTQGGQISRREVVAKRALRLIGRIDLALPKALYEFVRRQVDQLDLIGALQDRVRNRLAHTHPRDTGDHVVEAFDVLHVQRRPDIDAGGQ